MAAYAALVSLNHIMRQIEYHPRPPISLDDKHIYSLSEKVAFLQDFLECYSINGGIKEADHHVLESRIADAAYAAEDIIKSHIVDQIQAASTRTRGRYFRSIDFSSSIEEMNREMDFIKREVKTSEERAGSLRPVFHRFAAFFCGLKRKNKGRRSMEAYVALVSLMNIIEQIEQDPRLAISLDKEEFQSLIEKVTFLQDFLKSYYHVVGRKDADALERYIAAVAHEAKEKLESHVADQIRIENINQGLQKVIQDMDLIERDVMEMEDQTTKIQDTNSILAGSLRSPPTIGHNIMVGFDDVMIEIMDKLTGQQPNRQIIPIVGMGGIGKTTVSRNIYVNPLILQHFDIHAWATISQEYNAQEILLEILLCLKTIGSKESLSQKSDDELGEILYKSLSGRRYLIVMDDVWSTEAWDMVKLFFPDNSSGSRIIITTRMSNLAFQLGSSNVLKMNFLDEDKSWNLLCQNVFGDEACPLELDEIGKTIARNCKGLPLSIVVIGGLLAKSKRTREQWEYIAENLISIVNLEENERCFKILHLSYNQLPVHLKPCFLYMGIFPEDSEIRVSRLIKLWVAEGFLKPIRRKNLEVVAEMYLKGLIDRNLVLVHKLGSSGNIKLCTIHDVLRDLCIKEAEKEKFFHVTQIQSLNISQGIHTQRRIGIHQSRSREDYFPQMLHDDVQPATSLRSLICNVKGVEPSLPFRLLRVLNAVDKLDYFEMIRCGAYSLTDIFQLVNSRHIAIVAEPNSIIPSSVYHLWNLQTLIVHHLPWKKNDVTAPFEIWKMPQLRHVKFDQLHLPDPSRGEFVLRDLQTLETVRDFICAEEVVNRIPNVKKLGIEYVYIDDLSPYCLDNLCRLLKLESLSCTFSVMPSQNEMLHSLSFVHSLKKLTLCGTMFQWEDMNATVGSLPLLQVLKLNSGAFIGSEWETVEGRFQSLKFLLINDCSDLEKWTTENTHFPRLERIFLRRLYKLKEIPLEIGEIPTLKSIELEDCSDFAVISAKEILEEQEELGNEGLKVRVVLSKENRIVGESLVSSNFQVEIL